MPPPKRKGGLGNVSPWPAPGHPQTLQVARRYSTDPPIDVGVPVLVQSVAGASNTATSTSNTATFLSSAGAGNLLVWAQASDKNTGTLTMPSGWTVLVSLPSASVSLYVAVKEAVGGETSIVGTTSAAPLAGNTVWMGELDSSPVDPWGPEVATRATHITDESSVSTWDTGLSGPALENGMALAFMAVDTATNVPGGSWSNGFANLFDHPSTSGAGAIHVGRSNANKGGAYSSAWTTDAGTPDQMSTAMLIFGRMSVSQPEGWGLPI